MVNCAPGGAACWANPTRPPAGVYFSHILANVLAQEIVLGVDLDPVRLLGSDALEIEHALEPVVRDVDLSHIKPLTRLASSIASGETRPIQLGHRLRTQHDIGLAIGIEHTMLDTLELLDLRKGHGVVIVVIGNMPDSWIEIAGIVDVGDIGRMGRIRIVYQLELKHDTRQHVCVKQGREISEPWKVLKTEC